MAKTDVKIPKIRVNSADNLCVSFFELYPDLLDLLGDAHFKIHNWDNEHRSIIFSIGETGTRILFSVTKGENGKWDMFRALLIPDLKKEEKE